MKKLILALVAACCTAGMLRAQEVVPADTLKAQPVVATVESQPVVEEKAETPKEPKEFKGRRKYFNIGYAWEKLDAVDYKSKEESELAAFLTKNGFCSLSMEELASRIDRYGTPTQHVEARDKQMHNEMFLCSPQD